MLAKAAPAADRLDVFAEHYVSNGFSAQRACHAVGYSIDNASRLLKAARPRIAQLLAERAAEVTNERVALELAAIAFANPQDLRDVLGKPLEDLPDDVQRSIEAFECDSKGRLVRVKYYSKLDALKILQKSQPPTAPAQTDPIDEPEMQLRILTLLSGLILRFTLPNDRVVVQTAEEARAALQRLSDVLAAENLT